MGVLITTGILAGLSVSHVVAIVSMAYQISQASKMKREAAKAADARKGFELTTDGAVTSLPIVYGRGIVGGARVYHNTTNDFKYVASNADKIFSVGPPANAATTIEEVKAISTSGGDNWVEYKTITTTVPATEGGLLNRNLTGGKNDFLFVQQALCQGPINAVRDLIINESMGLDDPSLSSGYTEGSLASSYRGAVKAAFRADCHYGQVNRADSIMAANVSQRSTAVFSDVAYASIVVRLDRDQPQFNGVPNVQFIIEGRKVRSFSGSTLSTTKTYSTNPALCLLDYLMDKTTGKGLLLDELDLASFEAAANVCDTPVLTNAVVGGRVWQPVDKAVNVTTRNLPLYECNIVIDTAKPIRDNVESLLATMGDARLVWSQGKYKLLLQYPVTNAAIAIAGSLTDDDLLMEDTIDISWPSASERLNHAIVKYHNEAMDFKEDSVAWPPKKAGNYLKGIGFKVYPVPPEANWADGDGGKLLSQYAVWSGSASVSNMSWKFVIKNTGTHTLTFTGDDSVNVVVNGVAASHGNWRSLKVVSFAGIKDTVVEITATITDTGGIKGFAGQIIDSASMVVWTSRSPAFSSFIQIAQTSAVYDEYLAEDSGIVLESDIFAEGITDYYHALAKAEELVRTSRTAFSIKFKYIIKDRYFEPGDIIKLDSETLALSDLYIRVNESKVTDGMSCEITGNRFDSTQLAWNVADDQAVRPSGVYSNNVPAPESVTYEPITNDIYMSSGKVKWVSVNDNRVVGYIVYYHSTGAMNEDGSLAFSELGRTAESVYNLPALESQAGIFGVRAVTGGGLMSTMTLSNSAAVDSGPVPPTLTGLVAISATDKALVTLTWERPTARADGSTYNDHAVTTVWRSQGVVFASAKNVGESTTNTFVDKDEAFGTVTYWVRASSLRGVHGELSATASAEFNHYGGAVTDPTIPPSNYNFSISVGFSFFLLKWSNPTHAIGGGHSKTAIYGVEVSDGATGVFGAAKLLGETNGTEFWYTAGTSKRWSFWVQSISIGGGRGTPTGPLTAKTTTIGTVDLGPLVVEAENIANNGITNQKLIPGLEAVLYWSGVALPTTNKANLLSWNGKLYKWNGTAYVTVVSAVDFDGQLVSNQIADAAINVAKFAQGIEPVSIVTVLPAVKTTTMVFFNGVLYKWNGTAYVKAVAAADVTGQIVSTQIADAAINVAKFAQGIEPVTVVTSLPSAKLTEMLYFNGRLYKWSGTSYVSAIAASEMTGQIVGTQIADAAINVAKFAQGIEPITVVTSLPSTKSTTNISRNGVLYKWNGSSYVTVVSASEMTGVLTSSQLSSIEAAKLTGQIVGTQITDNSITTAKVSAGAITTASLAAGAITADKLGVNSVTANAIAAGAISADKIVANSITAGQIATGAIAADEIAAGAINASKIAAGTITANEIAGLTITGAKIAAGAISADKIVANSITAGQIATGAISADQIAAGAINASKIAVGSITADQIASNSITGVKLQAGSITADKLQANSITSSYIAANTIQSANIATGAIVAGKLAAGAIAAGSAAIAYGAISNAMIGDATITSAKIVDAQVSTLKIAGNAVTVPMSFGNASLGSRFGPGSFSHIDSSAWQYFDQGFVSVILHVKIGDGYTNCRLVCRLQLLGGGAAPIFDQSTTTSSDSVSATAGGTVTIPHGGVWRIDFFAGNDHTAGSYRLESYHGIAFGSKR